MKKQIKNINIRKLFLLSFFILFTFYFLHNNANAITTDPSKLGIVSNGIVYDIATDGDQAYVSGIFF